MHRARLLRTFSLLLRKLLSSATRKPLSVEEMAQRWQRDLLQNVVPFWQAHSLDHEHGGFFTSLARDGTRLESTKYSWLNCRAVFMWSRLHNELRDRVPKDVSDQWFEHASLGAGFLPRLKDDATGRIYFSTTVDGVPVHMQRKPYAAVFYVLAALEFAEALRVRDGDDAREASGWLAEAVKYYELLRKWIDKPAELDRVPAPSSSGGGESLSNLADVMCLACLAEELLKRLPAQRERWMADVAEAQRRVAMHYDPGKRILHEWAHPTRGVETQAPAGRLFNPGHSIEVAWFLLHLCQIRPVRGLHELALDALEGSLRHGWDDEWSGGGGGLWYMLDVCCEPLIDATVTAEHKLWWPMCEALYACMLALEITHDEERWLPWLRKIHTWIYEHLCDDPSERAGGGGEWFGYLRRDGSMHNAGPKGGNYKGFFHVPRCLLFATASASRYLGGDAPAGLAAGYQMDISRSK